VHHAAISGDFFESAEESELHRLRPGVFGRLRDLRAIASDVDGIGRPHAVQDAVVLDEGFVGLRKMNSPDDAETQDDAPESRDMPSRICERQSHDASWQRSQWLRPFGSQDFPLLHL
jgi:hypothetical protein